MVLYCEYIYTFMYIFIVIKQSQVLNIVYIFIHLCDKWQYPLCVTYIMTCIGFIFGFEDYPLSMWLLNPSIYIFCPRCERYWWPVIL